MEATKQATKSQTADSNVIRLAEENGVLAEIGRIISSSADMSEVYAQFGEVVSKLLPLDRINITLAVRDGRYAETAYSWGISFPGAKAGDRYPIEGTIVHQVLQHQKPAVSVAPDVHDLAFHGNLTVVQQNAGIMSHVAVPLRTKNEIFGILQIQSKHTDVYQDPHVRLLSNIASQISGAISSARLYAQ
ncbi:MAG: GAF domain-containing protein [Chloroflexi bacterium]|nr:GAF domain-containing protein [Chloroflexota bacterium]